MVSAMPSPSLYLVDGSNFLFRAYHALPPLTTSAGVPTGAARGFASMLLRLLSDHQPSHVAVVFDAGGRDKRAELLPTYKANRSETPPELLPQFELARRLSRAFGLRAIDATDVEADDVIATLARKAQAQDLPVVVVSSDKDLMQLCVADRIRLLDTMKEPPGKFYGPKEVEEKFGVPPEKLGDVLALMGDAVDNLPGIPGVGPKTAAQLIQTFGSIDALLGRIDEVAVRGKDKIQAALRAGADQLKLVRRLVALDEAVETGLSLDDLARQPMQRTDVAMLLTELEMTTLLKRLTVPGGMPGLPDLSEAASVVTGAPVPVVSPTAAELAAPPPPAVPRGGATAAPTALTSWIGAPEAAVRVVTTAEELAGLVAALRAYAAGAEARIGLALALGGVAGKHLNARTAPLCGLAVFAPGAVAAYVPLGHRYLGAPAQLAADEALAVLRPVLESAEVAKIVAGAKEAHQALLARGVQLAGLYSDPVLCSYLLDPAEKHTLPELAKRHLPEGYPVLASRESLCQAGKHAVGFDELELTRAAAFVVAEARAALVLGELLRAQLDVAGEQLLTDMELPLARVLAVIEAHGIQLDVGVLEVLSRDTDARLRTLEAEIAAEAGTTVNLNSPKQLGELLFEKLGLPSVKQTKGKTGHSTDAEVLESLAADYPIARKIHEHRGLSKLKSTYMDQFPVLRDPRTGRLHTSYQQVVAATGRLSSTEPNLQNIPIRTELGTQIRRAFVAPPGCVLIAADYSQIELRVLAHLSEDPLLVSSFQAGEDVHTRTALEMFGPEEGKKSDKRRAAKMINYGIIYGLTDYGLATRLGIERAVAKQYIGEYFARYKRVKDFMEELVVRARREGGARTLLGRFRPLPDLTSRIYTVRAYAERMAKNTPLQGTAADLLKRAMIDVQAELERNAAVLRTRMLLTVHDELVLEAPTESEAAVRALVQKTMEQAGTLRVPLKVDVGAGANWADCD